MKTPYELAYDYAMHTGRCIFLTGKAGTGKTTFLRKLKAECQKQIVVAAPTGVAAINAEGVTLHSLFQLPPQIFLPTDMARKQLFAEMQMREQKRRVLRNMELLVIDEISMVRADLLDAVDAVLRHVRHRHSQPFGGVQVLFIGDLYQLSPVAREDDWQMLREFYSGPYFFQSHVFAELRPIYIELNHVFRQSDSQFIDILNEVRTNTLTRTSLAILNERAIPADQLALSESILLTTHNHKADEVNAREMAALRGREYSYSAEVEGTFPESAYPMDTCLTLKEGARVMFIRNDSTPDKRFYNGKIGVVSKLTKTEIIVASEGEEPIVLHRETWENVRYVPDETTDAVQTEVVGTFRHYPLRLAWAITVHKAQGLTFDRVVIDAEEAFAAGQVYVALSRCRTLEGISLLSKIPERALANALDVVRFTTTQPEMEAVEASLAGAQHEYILHLLCATYDFRDIISKWESLRRLVVQAGSFNRPETTDFLKAIMGELTEWQHIGETFQQQMCHILMSSVQDLDYLSSRLKAAANYFEQRLKPLAEQIKNSPAHSEDKDDARQFREQIEEVYTDILRRLHIMKGIWQKPTTEQYFLLRGSFRLPSIKISASPKKKKKVASKKNASAKEITKSSVSKQKVNIASFRILLAFQRGMTIAQIAKESHLPEEQVASQMRLLLQEGLLHLSQISQSDKRWLD